MSLSKSTPRQLAKPLASKSANNTPREDVTSIPGVTVASAPSSARGSIRSPRGQRVFTSGSDTSTTSDSTVKSLKISTRNYSIFVHQKAHGRGDGSAPLEESPDTIELTSKFVKFLRENRMKVPRFLLNVEQAGNESLAAKTAQEDDVTLTVKDRIKRFQGDKSLAFFKSYLDMTQKSIGTPSALISDFIAEGVDCEDKGDVTLRACQRCGDINTGNVRICDCGGTLIEFTTKLYRLNGQIMAQLPKGVGRGVTSAPTAIHSESSKAR